jgi:FlaG/FlaF family flagellin (archaellin)
VTFSFDPDARGGDWFVFDVILDTGQRVQYFITVGEVTASSTTLSANFTYNRVGNSNNVDLDGSSSTGNIQTYEWKFDGNTVSGEDTSTTTQTIPPGTDVTLTVTSNSGNTDSIVKTVQ